MKNKPWLRGLLIAVLVQAALICIYWTVERRRGAEDSAGLDTSPPTRIEGRLSPIRLVDRDGARRDFDSPQHPTLLHFWATWCPPCRVELPGLLEIPADHEVEVVAVALNPDWTAVDAFLAGAPAEGVFLGDADEIERTLGVRALPATFLVAPGGELRLRFDGARDWTDDAFVRSWLEAASAER